MDFNEHSNLAGMHAFLSASNPAWFNYDEDKLDSMYAASLAARRGTELHALAHDLIRLGVKLEDKPKTLNLYVNDAIGFRMRTEQVLFYSGNAFGTADAIAFNRGKLRIHDLKTGVTHTSEKQLEAYAALFCLEYGYRPLDIEIELRIYQNDEARVYEADPDDIYHKMDRYVTFDRRINAIRQEMLS